MEHRRLLFAVLVVGAAACDGQLGMRLSEDANLDGGTAVDAHGHDASLDANRAMDDAWSVNDASVDTYVVTTDDAFTPLPDAYAAPDAVTYCTPGTVSSHIDTRGGDGAVFTRPTYDYAPAVMLDDDGVYKMWWCGGIAGDHILYAEASAPGGPWHASGSSIPNSYDDVFQPTGTLGPFDGLHACDPAVIKVAGTYYLYYGGLAQDGPGVEITKLGVASGPDGRHFTRLNGGNPIAEPIRDWAMLPNQYGVGQPSVFWRGGYFYLFFSDTTAPGSNPVNGAGIYVWRSTDPTFTSGVEELSATGFTASRTRTFSFVEAFSADWAYSEVLDRVMVATHGNTGQTDLRFFASSLVGGAGEFTSIPGNWREGPGIVHTALGYVPRNTVCDQLPVDILRAVGGDPSNPFSWDLGWIGTTIVSGVNCPCVR